MEPRNARARKSLRLAVILSLALHGAVLFIHFSSSGGIAGEPSSSPTTRLDVVITPPKPQLDPSGAAEKKPQTKSQTRVLTARPAKREEPTWSVAQKKEMDEFLRQLAEESRPRKGADMIQQAYQMARELGRRDPERVESAPRHAPGGRPVEPFSLEMYFDAFLRKLNRSASFVKRQTGPGGSRRALVQITLNADGSLQSYKVLRAADQQTEISYIRSVVERAAPFAAFPRDIREATGALTVMMCITPSLGGDGAGFVRLFPGEECRD